ncbi:hypothetical protein JRQ81_015540 [Phrynocephalus forsythii]|uniref:Uncharacterized protein n=1 Tax=Phrynocephalus forsythii TaxID=171643 RepID=A0A9Q0XUR8_9SAUR|nr:hypothetical protein JRQ81_015540 [Phrynocephalus forsythii]
MGSCISMVNQRERTDTHLVGETFSCLEKQYPSLIPALKMAESHLFSFLFCHDASPLKRPVSLSSRPHLEQRNKNSEHVLNCQGRFRGSASPDSDLNFAIILKQHMQINLWVWRGCCLELGSVIWITCFGLCFLNGSFQRPYPVVPSALDFGAVIQVPCSAE